MTTTAHNITDIINYAKSVSEVVFVSSEDCGGDFSVEYMFSEFGAYAYECKVYGRVNEVIDRAVGYHEIYTEDYEIELMTCYDEEGEIINLTRAEERQIEEILKSKTEIEFY